MPWPFLKSSIEWAWSPMDKHHSMILGVKYMLEKNGQIDIPATGMSMYPFIQPGDVCGFVASDLDQIKKGDIILFLTENGHLVGHRYHQSFIKHQTLYHTFKGDANFQFDSPVLTAQCIGKLAWVKKRRFVIYLDGMIAKWWCRLVFTFPALPRLSKKYLALKNRFRLSNKEYPHASN